MIDKRTTKRIPHRELPLFFKTFNLEIGNYKNIKAMTVDASTSGIAFTIPRTVKDIRIWESVTMNSRDGRFKFFGNVVYISEIPKTPQQNRIGIKFV